MSSLAVKLSLFPLCTAMLSLAALAQSPSWNWVVDSEGFQDEIIWSMCTSSNGSTYVIGRYEDSFSVDGIQLDAPITPNSFHSFLCKFNSQGDVEWLKPLVDPESAYIIAASGSLYADSEDNVYVVGKLVRGSAVGAFEVSIAGASFTIPETVNQDVYLAKIDPDGNGIWAKNFSTSEYPVFAFFEKVVVDEHDYVYFHAAIQSSAVEIDGIVYPIIGVRGHVLARLSPDGDFVWFQSMGSEGIDFYADLRVAAGGGVLMGSMWAGDEVSVGGLTLVNPDALIDQNYDRWVAKIDIDGVAEWLVREGGLGEENLQPVLASTPSGGAMVLSQIADSIPINGDIYAPPGYLLTRYSNSGALEMVAHYPIPSGGSLSQGMQFIESDGNDNYFLAFNFTTPTFTFGDFAFNNAGGFSGTADFMIGTIDGNGTPLWATTVGGSERDALIGLAFSPEMGPVTGGTFRSSLLDFGSTTLTNDGSFTIDFFVAVQDFTSSIARAAGVENFCVYPNPAHELITIDLSAIEPGNHNLRIFDTRGSMLLTQKVIGGNVEWINVSNLPPGSYVALISANGMVYTSKFIKT